MQNNNELKDGNKSGTQGLTRFIAMVRCPYLLHPFSDCYCSQMNSQMTEKAVKFCGGDFKDCDVYQNHLTQEIQPA